MMRFTALLSFAAVVKSQGTCTSDTNGDNTVDGERREGRALSISLPVPETIYLAARPPALSRSR